MKNAFAFSLWPATFGLIIGLSLSWPDSLLRSYGMTTTSLTMGASGFAGGSIAWLLLEGSRHWLRSALAGVLTPFIAVLVGAVLVSLTIAMPLAPVGLVFVALPLSLPGALFGVAYWFVTKRISNRNGSPS